MELKFTAQVTLSEADIHRLIMEEVIRRHPQVKVIKVVYNISQHSSFGIGPSILVTAGEHVVVPNYTLHGANVTVEASK